MSFFGLDFGPFFQVLATLGGICGIMAPFAFWQASLIKPFREELDANPATRHDAARRLTDRRWWGPYRQALDGGLRRLDRWMGAPEAWRRGFRWCLALAFAYPVIAIVSAWAISPFQLVEGLSFLPLHETLNWWQRGAIFLSVATAAIVLALGFQGVILSRPGMSLTFAAIGTIAGAELVTSMFDANNPLVSSLLFLASTTCLGTIIGRSIQLSDRTGALLGFSAAAFVAIGAIIFVGSASSNNIMNLTVVLFWIMIPLFNATFDWFSWQVSRRLGRHLLSQLCDPPRNWVRRLWDNPLTHIGADVIVAIVLLIGLAWSLPMALRLYNGFVKDLGSNGPLMLDEHLCDAARDPLGAGIWATVMLISTLVPTLIHLGFVFASPFIAMFKPHPVWDARAAHLEGEGPPPAIDLRGMPEGQHSIFDPALQRPGLAEDGVSWLPKLHPEVTKQVAWELKVAQPLLQFMMVFAAGLLMLNLVLAWDMIWTPVPTWLLWAAHGFDAAPVQACLGVWL